MKQRLSLAKILKFAHDKGFSYNQIYKIRGEVRFIVLSDSKNENYKIVIEIPLHHSVIVKSKTIENISTLKTAEQNSKHIDYWSFLSPNITENCLFCRSSKVVTIFKDNGEIKSYSLTLGEEFEEDDHNRKTFGDISDNNEKPIPNIEDKIRSIINDIEKQENLSSKIILQDREGKEITSDELGEEHIPQIVPLEDLTEEELDQEYSDTEDNLETKKNNEPSEKDLVEKEEKILKETLEDLYKLESEADLDLGEFYLLVSLTEFYQKLSLIKEKIKNFYTIFLNEEENIRQSRLENLLIALSSLNPTIQNFFDEYTVKERQFKEQLNRLIPLYRKIKEMPEIANKEDDSVGKRVFRGSKEKLSRELKSYLPELRDIISIKKKEIYYIRDILNVALGKLEQDVERISLRCTSPEEIEEEIEEENDENEEEIEDNNKTN